MNAIKAQFILQNSLFTNALANISEEESHLSPEEYLNPIKWIAGHVVNTRMVLLGILTGEAQDADFQKKFGKGSSGLIDDSFPSMATILEKWQVVSDALQEALSQVSQARLDGPPPFQSSIPDSSLKGLIVYLAMHEAHHIGQLSILRRLVGKEAMSLARKS